MCLVDARGHGWKRSAGISRLDSHLSAETTTIGGRDTLEATKGMMGRCSLWLAW